MAEYSILYWHEIPSMVEATDRSTTHKAQLSGRFQHLIDLIAMKRGLAGTDAYLEGFRRGDRVEREGTAEAVAEAVKEELEAQFESIKKAALEQSKG
ncbi:MAG: virulence factor [Acidiferrobacterales bacterium]